MNDLVSLDSKSMEIAGVLAKSQLVPKDFRGKPEDILVAIMWGRELGIPPVRALNSIAVINGKPAVYGDELLALVKSHKTFAGHQEYIENEDDPVKMKGVCILERVLKTGKIEKTISEFDVKRAKIAHLWGKPGPWQQYPDRMLVMRARGFCIRNAFPDVIKGIITVEELNDYPPEAKGEPTIVSPVAQLDAAFPSSSTTGNGAVETVELEPATPDAPGLTTQEFLERIRALSDQEESPASQRRHDIADFLRAQQPTLEALSEEDRTLVENYKKKEIRRLSVEAKDEPEYATVAPTRKRSRVKR